MKRNIGFGLALVALIVTASFVVLAHSPAKKTEAAVETAPTASEITVFNSTNYASITLPSPGPYTEDFRYTICWEGQPTASTACVTSPWATDAGATGEWSQWIWPGMRDEMGANSHLIVQSVETRPLPAGVAEITNVQLGIELSEDNGGNLVNTTQNLGCESWVAQYTPIKGGTSPDAYSYLYGCSNPGSPSGTPDVMRIYISSGGTIGAALSGDMPSQMTPGETVTTSTITALNTGSFNIAPTSWTVTPTGPGTGTCPVTLDSFSTSTDPNTPPPINTCTTPVDLTASDLIINHSGTFTTPSSIPYELDNVAMTQIYQRAYSINNGPGCATDLDMNNGASASFFGLSIPFIHAAEAAIAPQCKTERIPETNLISYEYNGQYFNPNSLGIGSGQTGIFAVNPFTAPTATGTYQETWILSYQGTPLPGAIITENIVVADSGSPSGPDDGSGIIRVASLNSQLQNDYVPASWGFVAPTSSANPCNSGIAPCFNEATATYTNEPEGIYTILPGAQANLLNPKGYALNSVKEISIPSQPSTNLKDQLLSFAHNMLSPTADAVGFPLNNPQVQAITPSSSAIGFVILWDPTADMELSQSNISMDATTGGNSATSVVSITNDGAPGSELTWSASSDSSWLTVSPGSSNLPLGQNDSQNITVTTNPAGLSFGTSTTGTLKLTGLSTIDNTPIAKNLTVNFTVNASSTGGTGGGTGGGGGQTCGGTGAPCATCTFSASPSTIVVPQSATLTYDCSSVSSCSITNGSTTVQNIGASSSTASGTVSVNPTGSTAYTLSCGGSNGGSSNQVIQVNVGNSTLCESNPGGINCPHP